MEHHNIRGENMAGLDISEESFRKLPAKEQNTIIFKNTQEMKSQLNNHMQSFKFHKKITYTTLSFITGGFLLLLEYIFRK